MKVNYDWPTIEEYMELCAEGKRYREMSRLLELHAEWEEARSIRAELIYLEIKKTCYKAALRQKRKAAAGGTAQSA